MIDVICMIFNPVFTSLISKTVCFLLIFNLLCNYYSILLFAKMHVWYCNYCNFATKTSPVYHTKCNLIWESSHFDPFFFFGGRYLLCLMYIHQVYFSFFRFSYRHHFFNGILGGGWGHWDYLSGTNAGLVSDRFSIQLHHTSTSSHWWQAFFSENISLKSNTIAMLYVSKLLSHNFSKFPFVSSQIELHMTSVCCECECFACRCSSRRRSLSIPLLWHRRRHVTTLSLSLAT